MLGPFGETLVMDWGLAKRMDEPDGDRKHDVTATNDHEAITQVGMAVGTVGYMSPEQAGVFGKMSGRIRTSLLLERSCFRY